MPIAAVPAYLGKDFQHASPGMRFRMYLTLWGINRRSNSLLWTPHDVGYEVRGQYRQERDVKYENKVSALSEAKRLNDNDKKTLQALLTRQIHCFDVIASSENTLRLEAQAISPFTTGLGNEHPLENGFAFLNPYGLPYLPGSGVKGVLRQAARELASGDWGDTHEWSKGKRFPLMEGEGEKLRPVLDKNNRPVMLAVQDVFFGLESDDGDSAHLRGALTFWDVIPQIDGDSLMVEIMTPHQTHYYQQEAGKGMGSSNPHESGQPTPISFLTVPPGSGFTFHVQCDLAHLRRLAPELAADGKWKTLITDAFEHAFQWLGFGAKTAVGYGAMLSEAQRKAREAAQAERAAQRKEVARKREEALRAEQAVRWQSARIKFNRNNGALTAEKDGKTAIALQPKGQELLTTLPTETQKKVLANQFVKVTAYVSAGMLVRVESP